MIKYIQINHLTRMKRKLQFIVYAQSDCYPRIFVLTPCKQCQPFVPELATASEQAPSETGLSIQVSFGCFK